ncbi:hypothetical protein OVY01_14225 [Robbsia sp. Bb-Pol-6]|uniref:Pierisin-like domain-containing protein n=1 Tax=Robbsia betulipollinis TaxID=2981849 RepID=A0ABT3ZPA1_9BURK|nr:hypothetical protein [Robbsia betulipollinis]MCY0388371.1 hypothetical protein [Robbsia betulipollinis]
MPNRFFREKRILGRVLARKQLPGFVYRWDERDIAVIRREGFQPWKPEGTITLVEHVRGTYRRNACPRELSKYESQFVSTGSYGMLKRIDPTFACKAFSANLYRIRTGIALETGVFQDVNDAFDRSGIVRPYATQREWLKSGGIPARAIVAYMPGKTFIAQYDIAKNVGPEEADLKGWLPFL